MAVSLDEVLNKLTRPQRARVKVRAKELIEKELTLREKTPSVKTARPPQKVNQEKMAGL